MGLGLILTLTLALTLTLTWPRNARIAMSGLGGKERSWLGSG